METYTEAEADVHHVRSCTRDNFLPSLKKLPEKANKIWHYTSNKFILRRETKLFELYDNAAAVSIMTRTLSIH